MIIGSNYIFIENLPSTNTYSISVLRNQLVREGTVIHTNFQSAGRGQPGSKWESEDGKNLLFSIILYPTVIDASDQFIISMAISLGISDFLAGEIPQCRIKWPNDIYIVNDKIAGILIENSIMASQIENSVAGIGLNVNQDRFGPGIPNPVSMKMITGRVYNTGECLREVTSHLDKRYKQVISGSHDGLRQEYVSRLYRLNEWSDFRDKKGKFSGKILTVTNNGRLQIERKSGSKSEYAFKEVEFLL
jgi:BirA family transcriptional regulator, biotin operon repressor / biotin---[acetyl-CoA-carboxylase] ligase